MVISRSVHDDLEKLHEQHKAAGFDGTDLKGLPGTSPSYYFVKDPRWLQNNRSDSRKIKKYCDLSAATNGASER